MHLIVTLRILALLLLSSVILGSGASLAHEIRPAVVNLHFIAKNDVRTTTEVSAEIVLNIESLIAEIGPEHDNTDNSENNALYKQLRASTINQLQTELERFKPQLLSSIYLVDNNEQAIPLSLQTIEIPPIGNVDVPRDTKIVLTGEIPVDSESISWRSSVDFGEVIVRTDSNLTTVDFATLLAPGQQSPLIEFSGKSNESDWQVLLNYIFVGFDHILPKGLDHILFVVSLCLLTTRWQSLANQVTVFTVAHSITLALGIAGALQVSAAVVEPLIALSIVVVCVENLLTDVLQKWRLLVVFIFGLLHGLGFASVLEAFGLGTQNTLIALFGFNIGVEIGQLVIVVLFSLLVGVRFGQQSWYRNRISKPLSALVGFVGLYWFIQRVVA